MSRTIAIAGSVSLLLWVGLAWITHGIPGAPGSLANGFHYEVLNDDKPTPAYLGIHAALCLVLAFVLWKLHRSSGRRGFWLVIGFAVVFRVVLVPSVPIHESDFYRYLWDGKVAKSGINPFRFKPWDVEMFSAEAALKSDDPEVARRFGEGRGFSDDEIPVLERLVRLKEENPQLLERVSHPEVRTVYPPLAQTVFVTSSFLFGDSLTGMKFLILVFDLGVIACIAAILDRLGRNRLWILAYGWNPLVLKEFANSAHYDAVPVFFTVLAVWCAIAAGSKWKVGLALAGGTLAKFFSALLLPILIPPRISHWPAWGIFGLVLIAGFLPYLLWDGVGFERLTGGLETYGQRWHYNGGFFTPVWLLFAWFHEWDTVSSQVPAKIVCGLSLVAVVLFLVFRRAVKEGPESIGRRAFIVMAAFFVLSPMAFPWYYTWVIPCVCLYPSRAWIGLSFLLPLNYLDFHSEKVFPFADSFLAFIPLLWWLIWTPFAGLLIFDRWGHSFFPAHHHAITTEHDEDGPGDLKRFEALAEDEDAAD